MSLLIIMEYLLLYSTGAFSSFPLQYEILFSFWNNSNWNFVLKSQTIFVVLLWSITILIVAFLRPMSIKFIVIFLTFIFIFHANLIFKFLNKFYYLRSYTRPPWQTVVLLSIHSFLRFTLQQGSKQGFLTLLDMEVRVRQWKFWRKLQIMVKANYYFSTPWRTLNFCSFLESIPKNQKAHFSEK